MPEQNPGRKFPASVLGLYTDWDVEENFNLLIGAEVSDEIPIPSGFEQFIVPASRFMVFTVRDPMPESIVLVF